MQKYTSSHKQKEGGNVGKKPHLTVISRESRAGPGLAKTTSTPPVSCVEGGTSTQQETLRHLVSPVFHAALRTAAKKEGGAKIVRGLIREILGGKSRYDTMDMIAVLEALATLVPAASHTIHIALQRMRDVITVRQSA